LAETKTKILEVSKDLRNSTRKLMRQLKENPDVQGNQKLIKDHKNNLCSMTEALMHEMAES
jgi:alkyl hydroperoxide reductase subunit AhpC